MFLSNKIDIRKGDLTYGQRLQLGEILSNQDLDEIQRLQAVFSCLYETTPHRTMIWAYIAEYNRIIEGVQYWVEIESQLLHYEPTTEELQAGIEQYHKAVGDLSTLHSIAKAFGKDPDEVYNWKYSKVFGILLNDLESAKYQKRYAQIMQQKR